MRDLLPALEALERHGPVGRAVVTRVWGSAPRREGAVLLATADGRMAGSVSGGCVEASVVEAVGAAIASGEPRLLEYAVTDDKAWEVGLTCGGTLEVFVEPGIREDVLAAARAEETRVVASVIAGPSLGAPSPELFRTLAPELEAVRAGGGVSRRIRAEGGATVFLEVFPVRPTLLIVGAVHVAEHLVPMARRLGYRVAVADAREALLTRERFPEADLLIAGWPDEAFSQLPPTGETAVAVLTHDPRFDDPSVRLALGSDAFYVGAIGSRKTGEARRERLLAAGVAASELERLHAPIGLDLGGREPAEIALAILGEITSQRYGPRR